MTQTRAITANPRMLLEVLGSVLLSSSRHGRVKDQGSQRLWGHPCQQGQRPPQTTPSQPGDEKAQPGVGGTTLAPLP